MARRILLITQWFDPEPTFKGLVFARELIRQGFEVEVLTGFPNYPGGRIYAGYRIRFLQREILDGVHVTRVPLYPSHSQSPMKRVANYLSFAVTSLFYGLFLAKRADALYAYHPPLTVGLTACLIGFFRRTPVVYDIQDMWPDTLKATGMVRCTKLLNFVAAVCRWVYSRVNHIVVLSPGFKKLLVERGVPAEKIDVIYNWADEESLVSPQGPISEHFPSDEHFRILFAGNMGKAQALDELLNAAALLKKQSLRICFVMLGGGVEVDRLKRRALDMALNNVVFLPAVPMSNVGVLLQAADALIVHLRDDPLFKITVPSKTQAYMAVGKPILMAVDGDAANLVLAARCGVIAESENCQSIANAAIKLAQMSKRELADYGDNARSYYRDNLSLSAGVAQFARLFNSF